MKANTIAIIVISLLLLGGVYWYFSSDTASEPPLSAGASVNASQLKFQTLVREMQNITFDTDIFTDPRFTALADITTAVTPEPAGRLDPFAPIPGIENESSGSPR